MNQATFTSVGFELVTNRTRQRELLDELNFVVPWTEFTGLSSPRTKKAPITCLMRAPFSDFY